MILERMFGSLRQRFAVAPLPSDAPVETPVATPPPASLYPLQYQQAHSYVFQSQPQPAPQPPPLPAYNLPPQPVPPARLSAVDILRNEPDLTAAQLARRAKVTPSYASTLIRRQRAAEAAAANPQSFSAAPVMVPPVEAAPPLQPQMPQPTPLPAVAAQSTEQLALAPAELDFILKVERLKKNLKI